MQEGIINLIFLKNKKYKILNFWQKLKCSFFHIFIWNFENSDVTFSHDHFDILYVFFRCRLQKLMPFYLFLNFLCKKSRNSNLLIFPNSRLRNIQESQKILFFEFSIIFFCILQS